MQKDVEKTPGELVVAISSRALFDLEEEHRLFEEKGYSAFRDFQLAHKRDVLKPGVAFPFVRRLLSLNVRFAPHRPLRVVVLSRNSPETAQRFFYSCRHYELPILAGAFTSGHSTFPYIRPFNVSLFLSANRENVKRAIEAGLPAGLVLPGHKEIEDDTDSSLRIAFDFDGVIAGDESERAFQQGGLAAFHEWEEHNAERPHQAGPLRGLFEKLSSLQRLDYDLHGRDDPYFHPALRISIVTSRGAPSEERLIKTLKTFGMSAAELVLLDGLNKRPVLEAIRPHIFFDDQLRHLEDTASVVPSVLIPFGIHNETKAE
jgi:5'-nucleotidase